MGQCIAVVGEGGSGKTTFAAMLIIELVERRTGDIMAVDAGGDNGLNMILGLEVRAVISDVLEEITSPRFVPAGMDTDRYLEYRLFQSITESKELDLLKMGRPQGSGCYCLNNNVLQRILNNLAENYDFMVVDCGESMEYVTQRTIPEINRWFIISDATVEGLRFAGQVFDLIQCIQPQVDNVYFVVTKVGEKGIEMLAKDIEEIGIPLVGTVPFDELVSDFALRGTTLFDLPETAPALQATRQILARAGCF
ncbi:MAG: ATP-binding protein [Eubacteriales bacterium]